MKTDICLVCGSIRSAHKNKHCPIVLFPGRQQMRTAGYHFVKFSNVSNFKTLISKLAYDNLIAEAVYNEIISNKKRYHL